MPDRRRKTTIGDLNISRGGYNPLQRAIQSELSRTPEAFDYSQLDERYPMRQVTPMVPPYIQQEMEEERIAQKEKDVMLKVRQAQLDNYESELNDKNAIAEQVIAARPEFAMLNPQDEDFIEKSDELFMKYPKLESSNDFMNGQFARLLRVHERTMNKKKPKTPDALTDRISKAMEEKVKFSSLRDEGKIDKDEADQYIEMLNQTIDKTRSELGFKSEDRDIAQARKIISKRPELKDEVNKRLISAGKQPIP